MPWFLKMFSKKRILSIFRQIWRAIFNELYAQISGLVVAAEYDTSLETGFDKAQWVYKQFIAKHDTWSDWKWVIQITIDIAHVDLVKAQLIPNALQMMDAWTKKKN